MTDNIRTLNVAPVTPGQESAIHALQARLGETVWLEVPLVAVDLDDHAPVRIIASPNIGPSRIVWLNRDGSVFREVTHA